MNGENGLLLLLVILIIPMFFVSSCETPNFSEKFYIIKDIEHIRGSKCSYYSEHSMKTRNRSGKESFKFEAPCGMFEIGDGVGIINLTNSSRNNTKFIKPETNSMKNENTQENNIIINNNINPKDLEDE